MAYNRNDTSKTEINEQTGMENEKTITFHQIASSSHFKAISKLKLNFTFTCLPYYNMSIHFKNFLTKITNYK